MSYATEHILTDFLIIGGGVAGLRAAIELARAIRTDARTAAAAAIAAMAHRSSSVSQGTTTTGGVTTHGTYGKASKTARVASVQLVLTRQGRVLYVKVLSPKKTAKIRISLMNSKHQVMKTALRNVKTGHLVKVKGLLVGKQVKNVRVVVLH